MPVTVTGEPGEDVKFGSRFGDTLDGGWGGDQLGGGDHLLGGPGPDLLVGGTGVDLFEAGTHADTINAADGNAEIVRRGLGGDTVTEPPRIL